MLDRCIDKLLYLSECNYFVKLSLDLHPFHTEYRSVQIDVLASGQLRMKAGADFKQRSYSSRYVGMAFRWVGDTRKNFEQRALSCSVAADNADYFAAFDFEGNVLEGPQHFGFRTSDFGFRIVAVATGERSDRTERTERNIVNLFAQSFIPLLLGADAVALTKTFDFYCYVGHGAEVDDQRLEIRSQRSEISLSFKQCRQRSFPCGGNRRRR